MCDKIFDYALSLAHDHLLPLARDHLVPVLRATPPLVLHHKFASVSLFFNGSLIGVRQHGVPVASESAVQFTNGDALKEAVNIIKGVPKEIEELKDELERIEEFINNADRMVDAEVDNTNRAIKATIKQLIEASFLIQDVIDEYMIREEQQHPSPGYANYVKTKILRLEIAYKIQNIKSQINEIKEKSEKDHGFLIQSCSEKGSSSSTTNLNTTLVHNLQEAPFYMDEADFVGFEVPRDKLIDWLVNGREERTVISVVGLGGQGKTTLAKKVFDNHKVIEYFDCHVWISVSQSYNIEGLLRDMLQEFCKQLGINPPQSLHQMNRESLVDKVRNYLQEKRYVVVFDDVWNLQFWDDIEFAMIDNKKGCKILITTRKMSVVNACRKSSFVEVHKLECLGKEQSIELFNKKAFHDLNGCCPENLIDISSKIVEKCNGLPLAIVVAGGLLSCKDRNIVIEWYKFNENLKLELKENSKIRKILGLSYHDLPYNLKSCLLYFGLFPEDCVVKSKTLVRQWVAEGFVKEGRGKTLEEVGKGYLTELINRSLVQVVSISIDGRAKSCRVHDLVRAMILDKCDDLSFCKNVSEDDQPSLIGMVRRLSISTGSDDLMESIKNSQVRSLLIVSPNKLLESFAKTIPTKYRRLKVLDLERVGLDDVPKGLGSLNHLKYFRFKDHYSRGYCVLPKSIENLENLETLDLTNTDFDVMPKEICKLRKLRHFRGRLMSLIELKDGIGGMTSLQTLRDVYFKEDDDENSILELIEELGKLKQLRELTLLGVKSEYMSVMSSSINKMQKMEKLYIETSESTTIIDMDLNSPPPMLRSLRLSGKLNKLPKWIPKHENLVRMILSHSMLKDDEMKLLNNIPNLLTLDLYNCAFEGEMLHFQDGCFKNLKELYFSRLYNLKYVVIDKGALRSLKKLTLDSLKQSLPSGIQHLEKLEIFRYWHMDRKLKEHWSLKHVPVVEG